MPREPMPTLQDILPRREEAPKRQNAKTSKPEQAEPTPQQGGEEPKARRTFYVPMSLDYRISQAHIEARRLQPGLSWSDWVSQLCEMGLQILDEQ
jgi:hypothetical protein